MARRRSCGVRGVECRSARDATFPVGLDLVGQRRARRSNRAALRRAWVWTVGCGNYQCRRVRGVHRAGDSTFRGALHAVRRGRLETGRGSLESRVRNRRGARGADVWLSRTWVVRDRIFHHAGQSSLPARDGANRNDAQSRGRFRSSRCSPIPSPPRSLSNRRERRALLNCAPSSDAGGRKQMSLMDSPAAAARRVDRQPRGTFRRRTTAPRLRAEGMERARRHERRHSRSGIPDETDARGQDGAHRVSAKPVKPACA